MKHNTEKALKRGKLEQNNCSQRGSLPSLLLSYSFATFAPFTYWSAMEKQIAQANEVYSRLTHSLVKYPFIHLFIHLSGR